MYKVSIFLNDFLHPRIGITVSSCIGRLLHTNYVKPPTALKFDFLTKFKLYTEYMRIPFNNKKALVIWAVVFCVLAALAGTTGEFGFGIAIFLWIAGGNVVTDAIIDKDWKTLRNIILIIAAAVIIGVILVQTGVW